MVGLTCLCIPHGIGLSLGGVPLFITIINWHPPEARGKSQLPISPIELQLRQETLTTEHLPVPDSEGTIPQPTAKVGKCACSKYRIFFDADKSQPACKRVGWMLNDR